MAALVANNAFATLAAGITSSATSITLTSGQGARFPALAGADYFYATLVDTANNLEIVKCTARSTDVLTVVRGAESTTANAYVTSDRLELRITAALLAEKHDAADIGVSLQAYDADTTKNDVANAFTATQTLKGITETEATNSTTTYTVDLANGTIFDLTSSSAVTITMPSVGAGKSFTIIVKTAPAWSGTILWSGATVPSATTISIYSFISDGTNWYGMEAGNGFA